MLEVERFENVLKSLRVRRGKEWTQEATASLLGVSRRTYVAWENGESLPSGRDLKNIGAAFQLNEADADTLFHAASLAAPVLQNLPFARNPFFTGRETLLERVGELFEQNTRIALTQPISISGLGGIGKTQLALEYAHRRHPKLYRSVLWVNASDKASLEASYLSLAHLLQLPEERAVERTVQAVKSWLEERSRWLLILDNADDLQLVRPFLPSKPRGHILLTTRSQIVGNLAALLRVEAMSAEEGLLFLLRRSGVLPLGTEPESLPADLRHKASELVELLGGHPLALDQAGAYIEETSDPVETGQAPNEPVGTESAQGTGSPTAPVHVRGAAFAEYKQIYQEQHRILLHRRGSLGDEHPETVATTFEISLQKACQLHSRCTEVLAFCAFLHPDAIPEELLRQKTGLDLDQLSFNEAIQALRKYSLIKRDSEKSVLSLHRLVQAVIRGRMDTQTFRRCADSVLQAVDDAFPEVRFEEWARCERYLPHALVCVNWFAHEAVPPLQAWHLLSKAGNYLRERGLYPDAEPLLQRALTIREQILGTEHPDTASSMNNLAVLYWQQSKYELAEPLYQRAISIREQHLGPEHPDTASSLNGLAVLYMEQRKYKQAEPLYQRALAIRQRHLGPEHPRTADSLNNLAVFYMKQGKYEQAEPLYLQALLIREQHLGPEHPDTAISLNNLAIIYKEQGKYEQAEPLYQRAFAIWERHSGPEHPDTAVSLNNLAIIYKEQGKYEQAEPLFLRAFAIWEQRLGAEHPNTAECLNELAVLYRQQGKYEQAEPLFLRALAIREQRLGADLPDTAECLNELAVLYQQQGKYEQAEPLFLRALTICEQHLGAEHPLTVQVLRGLAELSKSV